MDILDSNNIFIIQRTVSIPSAIISCIGIYLNILQPDQIYFVFNLMLLIFTLTLNIVFFFVNHKICQFVQAAQFVIVGIISILFDERTRYIGDILFTIGVVLLIGYRIIKEKSILLTLGSTITLVVLKLISSLFITNTGYTELMISTLTVLILLVCIAVLNNRLSWYIESAQKIENYTRAGINITGYAHSFKVDAMLSYAERTKELIIREDYEAAIKKNEALIRALDAVRIVKENILKSSNINLANKSELFNIHDIINTIVFLESMPKNIKHQIIIETDFYFEDIFIKGYSHEFYLICQNIITNSIESISKRMNQEQGKFEGKILIKTVIEKNFAILSFIDNGIGFVESRNNESTQSSEKAIGGFGIPYITTIAKKNKSLVNFSNNPNSKGVITKLKIPFKGEYK